MRNELSQEELIKRLKDWWRDEENIKLGMLRALTFKGKDEKAKEVVKELTLRSELVGSLLSLLSQKEVSKTAQNLLTINRFIKLLNEMPEDVQQGFYQQMASKLKEPSEEWIDEKALELNNEILLESHEGNYFDMAKDFICTLAKELLMRKPKVTK